MFESYQVSWSWNVWLLDSASFELVPGILKQIRCLYYIFVNNSSFTKTLLQKQY